MTPQVATEKNWQDFVSLAEHHKAVGWTDIHLWKEQPLEDFPWQYVISMEAGGGHRLDIRTSTYFTAKHPCGLTFSWSYEIEPRTANGSNAYQIDVVGCRIVLRLLSPAMRSIFRAYLWECSRKVATKAREWREITSRQEADAATLTALASELDAP